MSTRILEKTIARKDFRFHGKAYARGDEFPWRKLSCSERRVILLIDAGFVMLERDMKKATAKAAEAQVEQEPVEDDDAADADEGTEPSDESAGVSAEDALFGDEAETEEEAAKPEAKATKKSKK